MSKEKLPVIELSDQQKLKIAHMQQHGANPNGPALQLLLELIKRGSSEIHESVENVHPLEKAILEYPNTILDTLAKVQQGVVPDPLLKQIIENKNAEIIAFMQQHDANPNSFTQQHDANPNSPALQLLLELIKRGSSETNENVENVHPLQKAILEYPNTILDPLDPLLKQSIENKNAKIIAFMQQHDANPNSFTQQIIELIKRGSSETNENVGNVHPLQKAILEYPNTILDPLDPLLKQSIEKIIAFMQQHGANPNGPALQLLPELMESVSSKIVEPKVNDLETVTEQQPLAIEVEVEKVDEPIPAPELEQIPEPELGGVAFCTIS